METLIPPLPNKALFFLLCPSLVGSIDSVTHLMSTGRLVVSRCLLKRVRSLFGNRGIVEYKTLINNDVVLNRIGLCTGLYCYTYYCPLTT